MLIIKILEAVLEFMDVLLLELSQTVKVKSVQCLSNRLIMKRLNSHGLTFVSVKRIVGLHVFVLETQAKNIHMYKLHMDNCRRWQCFLVQSW